MLLYQKEINDVFNNKLKLNKELIFADLKDN